jgi:predicted ATPase
VSIALSLLGDVRWRGTPVVGDRPQALLAALAARGCRPVRPEELIELVWGDEAPRNGMKSLQVLVSRARTACGPDTIIRDGIGYRLGAAPGEVDSARLARLVRDAAAALDQDATAAATLAREALALTAGLPEVGDEESGPLAEVRRTAAADAAATRVILARAASRAGEHPAALPVLVAAHAERPQDEPLLADLLRSEAVVDGPAAALDRFERYRRDLRDRLGADPGEVLQRTHRALLALDHPVRRGVHYDATELIGRDSDLERLRALMTSSRIVSIVGPGGLGKTRLAHVLARDAVQPVVHVVELAGVTSAEDVAVEVGSVLGVRDSVSGRSILTAAQRADIRARIAQRLGQSPGLLVLDNCEHLIGAVAELVVYLISATPDLRVLTTSRSPLALAAERVYQLGELEAEDAAALFRERATAARPSVRLTEESVASIVGRLDGLPLAIELAAAKVRVMALEEIDRRLEDRFALLRGGDRGAPGRHQALLTVIEWSWNLLDAAEQRALRWLALFHDGFTLAAAESVLGRDAVDAVRGLADQSLLNVRETITGVRYRMLETVREFGRIQLVRAGDDDMARAAQRRWAAGYASVHLARIASADQFAAIDALEAEETNLADELRGAIADGDGAAVVRLLSALGLFWTMRGEHMRLLVLANAVTDAIRGWRPPPGLEDAARGALAIMLSNLLMIGSGTSGPLLALLRELGPATDGSAMDGSPAGGNGFLSGLARALLEYDPADLDTFRDQLDRLARDEDRHAAAAACQWLSQERENVGDLAGASEAAEYALTLARHDDGPWARAMPHGLLAQLTMNTGDRPAAIEHARAALPVMRRLGARDDEVQLHALIVFCAIADGRLADAEAELGLIDRIHDSGVPLGVVNFQQICRAEIALASGNLSAGLRLHRESAAWVREASFPQGIVRTGHEPWALFGEAMALSAHARYASDSDQAHGRVLFGSCREGVVKVLSLANSHLDYPAAGIPLFALGAWSLQREAGTAEDALGLLALAERFAYNQTVPTMMWDRITPAAEAAAPGLLAELQAGYRDRRPPDLLTEARRAVERLQVPPVTAH